MELTKAQRLIYDMETIIGGAVNVICAGFIYDGKADIPKIQWMLQEVYKRNDAFRIRIHKDNGRIYQTYEEHLNLKLEFISVSTKEELHEYAEAFAKIPLNIHEELIEIKVFISENFWGTVSKCHHIMFDSWSGSLIANQYAYLLNEQEFKTYSYLEHVKNEQRYLSSKRYQIDRNYFLSQFEKCPEPMCLFQNDTGSKAAKRCSYSLTKEQSSDILSFMEKHHVSLFSFFLVLWSVCQSKFMNNLEKFYIGTPILNRTGIQEKNTVGMFVNTIPLLIELNYRASFLENLLSMQETILPSVRHQKFNYEDIMEELWERYHFKGRLYDVMINYENSKVFDRNVQVQLYHSGIQNESLQIRIEDREDAGVIKLHYDYQIEKFTESDIGRLHGYLCNLLSAVLHRPEQLLCKLDMLSNQDKEVLLKRWNNTSYCYKLPSNTTLYHLFEKHALNDAHRIALRIGKQQVTYGELQSYAKTLDYILRSHTLGKKSIIAVMTDRSVEMYAAIYGIIRGGNAYLPLATDYPEERISYILNDSNAIAVVAGDNYLSRFTSKICINMTEIVTGTSLMKDHTDELAENHIYSNQEALKVTSASNYICEALPQDTAYVIYTSGSTGAPKGVKISHQSVLNRILWMQHRYPLEKQDVILQKTPYTFDVSVWEIFWWGIQGNSLAVSKPNEHFLPEKILAEVRQHQVTHLHFVPSVFELFLTYLEQHKEMCQNFLSVKHVFLSGETLHASLVHRFYALFSYLEHKLHNLYGPTECAIDVTSYDCTPDQQEPVPIGKPIYNTEIYVLDNYMQPTPIEVPGELCISGISVGQGYLNQPELTEEVFVSHPFKHETMYKTGDFAYWNSQGELIFCGRRDEQIKFHGQRIELKEIEYTINQLDGIESSVVLVRRLAQQELLVVYYVSDIQTSTSILDYCKKNLPPYMVPSAAISLAELPLNSNGKLDRNQLASMDISYQHEHICMEPETELEQNICKAFAQALNMKAVGRTDDFFALGGSSLSMISLLSEELFKTISVTDFIANPTPEKLATFMEFHLPTELSVLKALETDQSYENVLILVPFAGGGAEAYGRLTNDIRTVLKDCSIYFIPFLHSRTECELAAKEIMHIAQGKRLYIYSHCAGATVAMQIINLIEETDTTIVSGYISGGFIPTRRPGTESIWTAVNDEELTTILEEAGAALVTLPLERQRAILQAFRKDTDYMTLFYHKYYKQLQCPVYAIISQRDYFTQNYDEAEVLWKQTVQDFRDVYFLDACTHYFQNTHSKEMATIIKRIITA